VRRRTALTARKRTGTPYLPLCACWKCTDCTCWFAPAPFMLDRGYGIYWLMRSLLRTALGFYFNRIERFHAERVPTTGPVLFTSNHPNSLTDAFVIGASVPRKVNFVATIQLFRLAPLRWLLLQCGVVPINRVK